MGRIFSGLAIVAVCGLAGCSSSSDGDSRQTILVEGSDTMANVAQAWAERYHQLHPDVSVQVSGGGSGTGIASLINGTTEMANSSRQIKPSEAKKAESKSGQRPTEHVVGIDALAVYVHKDNPLDTISIPELAEIYGEGGSVTTWTQLSIKNAGCTSDKIMRVSRQNSSGTYAYFRESVMGKDREYELGSIDQSGSKDVVALVSRTPCAIGYSGMGYQTDEVKVLKIAAKKGEPGVEPTVATAKDGSYPISRPLLIYTLGEPTGALKDYIDWIQSEEGQRLLLEMGYVPIMELSETETETATATAESEGAP